MRALLDVLADSHLRHGSLDDPLYLCERIQQQKRLFETSTGALGSLQSQIHLARSLLQNAEDQLDSTEALQIYHGQVFVALRAAAQHDVLLACRSCRSTEPVPGLLFARGCTLHALSCLTCLFVCLLACLLACFVCFACLVCGGVLTLHRAAAHSFTATAGSELSGW